LRSAAAAPRKHELVELIERKRLQAEKTRASEAFGLAPREAFKAHAGFRHPCKSGCFSLRGEHRGVHHPSRERDHGVITYA
jgi:hypothetical protein